MFLEGFKGSVCFSPGGGGSGGDPDRTSYTVHINLNGDTINLFTGLLRAAQNGVDGAKQERNFAEIDFHQYGDSASKERLEKAEAQLTAAKGELAGVLKVIERIFSG